MFVLAINNSTIQTTDLHVIASYQGKHKLVVVILQTLKWPLLIPILPRLVLMAFTYCQPLLVTRFLDYLQSDDDSNVGRGLIGAYVVVYFGIAVSCCLYNRRKANVSRSQMASMNINYIAA